jgi:hypothetical protein
VEATCGRGKDRFYLLPAHALACQAIVEEDIQKLGGMLFRRQGPAEQVILLARRQHGGRSQDFGLGAGIAQCIVQFHGASSAQTNLER